MTYFIEEKVVMIKWFYGGNSHQMVADMFSVQFPNRPIPSASTIGKIIKKFEIKGTVLNNCQCKEDHDENLNEAAVREGANANDRDLNVLLRVEENKNVSTRTVGNAVEMHHSSVLRILQKHHYHSYKYERHQELLQGDEERRSNFCFTLMEMSNNNREFLRNICFSDECCFTLNNEPNVQNFRYWSKENEHRYVSTRTQYPQKINVWAGIFGHRIIGPFFFDQNLTSDLFLHLLQTQIRPALEEVIGENQDIWFQMDGCPAHNSRVVRQYLMDSFHGNVIGPNHQINWPARSPDLSPNDFFLWGHIKDKLYKNVRFQNLHQLQNSISAICDRISVYQLANVRREFYDRLGYCLAVNGGLFEHLLKH